MIFYYPVCAVNYITVEGQVQLLISDNIKLCFGPCCRDIHDIRIFRSHCPVCRPNAFFICSQNQKYNWSFLSLKGMYGSNIGRFSIFITSRKPDFLQFP